MPELVLPPDVDFIVISSDEEDGNDTAARPSQSRAISHQHTTNSQSNLKRKLALTELRGCLSDSLWTNLIPPDTLAYLVDHARERLDGAKAAGAGLDELYIDENGLPSWHTDFYNWDPQSHDLHDTIQGCLVDLQLSRELGEYLRSLIQTRATHRLNEARALRLRLDMLQIGADLLPTWEARPVKRFKSELNSLTEYDAPSPAGQREASRYSFPDSDIEIDHNQPEPEYPDSFTIFGTSKIHLADNNLDSESDSSSSSSEAEDIDDTISLDNFLSPFAHFEDDLYEALNVVTDVELVGMDPYDPDDMSLVDLEVFMVEDTDHITDLPEVEFAIDRAAYMYHYSGSEAIDLETSDFEILCSGRLGPESSDDSDGDWDDFNEHTCPDTAVASNCAVQELHSNFDLHAKHDLPGDQETRDSDRRQDSPSSIESEEE